jgi:hypothetical protein
LPQASFPDGCAKAPARRIGAAGRRAVKIRRTPDSRNLSIKDHVMSLSLYQAAVPPLQKMLGNLKAILQKGEAHAAAKKIDATVMLNARLSLDMFTLTRQVQIATDVAKGLCARLTGQEAPKFEDTEATFADLYARIDKTLAYIATFKAADLDGQEQRDITITPGGKEMHFKGQPYLLHWALPNFYFHVMATYLILRHVGVEVGKMDYLGSF